VTEVADINENSEKLIGEEVSSLENNAKTGVVMDGKYNTVVSMVRYEHMTGSNLYQIGKNMDVAWQVIIPHWME